VNSAKQPFVEQIMPEVVAMVMLSLALLGCSGNENITALIFVKILIQ
jgi:hypothetical protein